jgi:aspartokinase
LREQWGDEISVLKGYGTVSAIGAGINSDLKNLQRGNAVLDDIIEISTTPMRITWVMRDDRLDESTRRLHSAYLE